MNFFTGCVFISLLILGFTNGFQIGKVGSPKIGKEHSSLRIINGKKVPITKYPYMVSLKIIGSLFGSGVIIDKRWVLTSAVNVAGVSKENIELRVGSNLYSSGGQVLEIQDVILHENYTGSWDYDIAVLRVNPIKFGKKVKAIALGTTDVKAGSKGDVSGWGVSTSEGSSPSEVLLAAEVTVLDWQTCKNNYTTDLTPRLMCSFDKKQSPCSYDFGDPLVIDNAVYGLFAGGHNCNNLGKYPMLYTDVPALYSWVKGKISSYVE